jgi:type VI secretion system protein ImpJ
MTIPPRAIAASVETQYFQVTKQGPCWDHIVATRRVGVYLPGDFGDAEIELLVVLDG